MTPILIFGAGVIAFLILTGRAATMNRNDWLALALALLSANFARGGNGWMAGTFAAAAAYLYIVHGNKTAAGVSDKDINEARALLGVKSSADATTINAAWRKQLAQSHPDRGGDADYAQRINAARDVLIADLEARALPRD